jgi:hypothetical protein
MPISFAVEGSGSDGVDDTPEIHGDRVSRPYLPALQRQARPGRRVKSVRLRTAKEALRSAAAPHASILPGDLDAVRILEPAEVAGNGAELAAHLGDELRWAHLSPTELGKNSRPPRVVDDLRELHCGEIARIRPFVHFAPPSACWFVSSQEGLDNTSRPRVVSLGTTRFRRQSGVVSQEAPQTGRRPRNLRSRGAKSPCNPMPSYTFSITGSYCH